MYQYFSVRNKSAYDSVKITFLVKGYEAFFFLSYISIKILHYIMNKGIKVPVNHLVTFFFPFHRYS